MTTRTVRRFGRQPCRERRRRRGSAMAPGDYGVTNAMAEAPSTLLAVERLGPFAALDFIFEIETDGDAKLLDDALFGLRCDDSPDGVYRLVSTNDEGFILSFDGVDIGIAERQGVLRQ